MFKFLRKKLKRFEDKLEEELEGELQKEQKKTEEVSTPPAKPVPSTEPPLQEESVEPPSEDQEELVTEEQPPFPTTVEKPPETVHEGTPPSPPSEQRLGRLRRRRLRDQDRRRREEELDKQLEKSIEEELQHTLRTKRGIEQVVKTTAKPTRRISEDKLEELLWDLEVGLLESDVAYSVIESIKQDIKQELQYVSFERGKIGEMVEEILRRAIAHVLESTEVDFNAIINKDKTPVVIMFVGVNGSGKTLSIGKMAMLLKKMGKSVVMAAGDTFRAGAIEQLSIHAENVGVKIIKHGPGADPAAVAFDAIDHAKAKHKDVVLLDTAGRMQTNVNLMDEMAKIKRVAKPDFILFVGDALAGNDAVEQAKRFNEVVGIDGVILTKVDTDAKGGSALSVAYTIGKPLLFIGVGQGYEDQIPFSSKWMIDNIFSKASS
jgi:fused signal recognition particle receptor